jgi:hypothetical protein
VVCGTAVARHVDGKVAGRHLAHRRAEGVITCSAVLLQRLGRSDDHPGTTEGRGYPTTSGSIATMELKMKMLTQQPTWAQTLTFWDDANDHVLVSGWSVAEVR